MDGEVDAPLAQRLIELLGEKTLPPDSISVRS